ncbi:hypothetical protein K503DRAFT_804544 [Rhizopogon vinicolor AM-OR11-026]|uniref:Uncharacterized protein n=1 Tax=Rhizopogon vinicolor AM-OR11-026 TaxID=1314800 RepID=A0A1B7MKW3_9AGAM|nr:hypothetical protein K503DRAFT_804544 [Rhizopogon vinicolor AM-OR11-026]
MNILNNRRKRTASIGTLTPDSVSPPDTWVDVDISTTDYARRRRELMEMMADLRSMGADTLIDLPAVVVIGGQSGL